MYFFGFSVLLYYSRDPQNNESISLETLDQGSCTGLLWKAAVRMKKSFGALASSGLGRRALIDLRCSWV